LLNLKKITDLADVFILVTATSKPHLKALAEYVWFELKQNGITCTRKSGNSESGWIILDYHDIVVHLFLEEKRKYYALEEFWTNSMQIAKSPRRKSVSRSKFVNN